jgi:hypothetical protein
VSAVDEEQVFEGCSARRESPCVSQRGSDSVFNRITSVGEHTDGNDVNLTSDIRLQYAWGRSRPKAAEGARNPKSGASSNPLGGGGERTIWNEAERAGNSGAAEAGWGSRETSSAGSIVSSEEGRDTWSESNGRYREANSDLKGAL